MRRFRLNRREDPSGISGTGIIAEGVQYSDGSVTLRWLTQYHSTGIYDSMEQCQAIHSHNGKTQVEWIDKDDSWEEALTQDLIQIIKKAWSTTTQGDRYP